MPGVDKLHAECVGSRYPCSAHCPAEALYQYDLALYFDERYPDEYHDLLHEEQSYEEDYLHG